MEAAYNWFLHYGAFVMIYLIFQLGMMTFARLMGKGFPQDSDGHISRRTYLICLIPGLGILYGIYRILKQALST